MTLPGRTALAVFFLTCASLAGCASTSAPGQVRLEGVLVHRVPPPGVQSVEAYLGERKIKFQGPQPKPMMLRVTGKLGTDRDFGSGYKYPLIIEDATVVVQ